MKTRRKHSSCLNCGELLDKKYNFCPNCGQENTDNEVSIGMLLREFTSNFFSLDSRFGRTFKPFLFSPGKITEAFNSGKRVFYANPIRWYLVISIFHFFFMAKIYQPTNEDKNQHGFIETSKDMTRQAYDSLYHLPDTSSEDTWPLTSHEFAMIHFLSQQSDLSPNEIMDSLAIDEKPLSNRLAARQFIRLDKESKASLNSYLIGQIPVIVFFILPIYAFLLKLFFWKKGLYIKHLIHSIHLHALFFFLLTITWIVTYFWPDFQKFGILGTVFLTSVYVVLSFRRIYKNSVIRVLFKLFGIGFLYLFSLSFVFVIGILLSLLLF